MRLLMLQNKISHIDTGFQVPPVDGLAPGTRGTGPQQGWLTLASWVEVLPLGIASAGDGDIPSLHGAHESDMGASNHTFPVLGKIKQLFWFFFSSISLLNQGKL